MQIVYGVTICIALALFIGYVSLVKKKQAYLVCLYISVFIVNLGYFILSRSKTLNLAIGANCVAYFGSVFLSTFMLLTIIKLCGFKYKKWLPITLISISAVMFLLTLTQCTSLTWYYESVSLTFEDGAAKLVKVYGPLHAVYLAYIVLYFLLMIVSIVSSLILKKGKEYKHALFLLSVVFFNVLVWFAERYIPFNFEFLSVTYIISELILLVIYWMIEDYILISKYPQLLVADGENVEYGEVSDVEKSVLKIIGNCEEKLTTRETEVLKAILEHKRRKEIASELNLSENTVKTHTAHFFINLAFQIEKRFST